MMGLTVLLSLTNVGVSASKVPILMSITLFRGWLPYGWFLRKESPTYSLMYWLGGVLIVYMYTSALLYVPFIMYKQKLLFNILKQWVIRLAVIMEHPIATEEAAPEVIDLFSCFYTCQPVCPSDI